MHARMQHLRQDVTPCCLLERAELALLTFEKRQKTLSRPSIKVLHLSASLLPLWMLPGRLARAGTVLACSTAGSSGLMPDIPHMGQRQEGEFVLQGPAKALL